jgi:hypothetical protein
MIQSGIFKSKQKISISYQEHGVIRMSSRLGFRSPYPSYAIRTFGVLSQYQSRQDITTFSAGKIVSF